MGPPIPIQTQREISALVREACRSVITDAEPIHVPVRLESFSRAEDCHGNVAGKVSRDGGLRQSGWVVWEIPEWEIQLEFHSVWQSPNGTLIDVTPALHGGPEVLFVRDPARTYEGNNIPTVHYPYYPSSLCRDYVKVADEIGRMIFPPGKACQSHEVPRANMEALKARLREIFKRAKQS
jgi:hypothetical protein